MRIHTPNAKIQAMKQSSAKAMSTTSDEIRVTTSSAITNVVLSLTMCRFSPFLPTRSNALSQPHQALHLVHGWKKIAMCLHTTNQSRIHFNGYNTTLLLKKKLHFCSKKQFNSSDKESKAEQYYFHIETFLNKIPEVFAETMFPWSKTNLFHCASTWYNHFRRYLKNWNLQKISNDFLLRALPSEKFSASNTDISIEAAIIGALYAVFCHTFLEAKILSRNTQEQLYSSSWNYQ